MLKRPTLSRPPWGEEEPSRQWRGESPTNGSGANRAFKLATRFARLYHLHMLELSDARKKLMRADELAQSAEAAWQQVATSIRKSDGVDFEVCRISSDRFDVVCTHFDFDSERFQLEFADCLNNYRSALDFFAYAANDQIVTPKLNEDRVFFPICTRRRDVRKSPIFEGIKRVDHAISNSILNLEPWKSGESLIWDLDNLNNISKHRFLLRAQSSVFVPQMGMDFSSDKYLYLPKEMEITGHTLEKLEKGTILLSSNLNLSQDDLRHLLHFAMIVPTIELSKLNARGQPEKMIPWKFTEALSEQIHRLLD